MRRILLVALAIGCFASAASALIAIEPALQSFHEQSGEISIVGGTAPLDLMKAAARRISAYNPNVRVNVSGGGSGEGIRLVGEGKAQISNSGRPLKQEEIEKYGLESHPFAVDAIAVAIGRRNPVANLSREQLRGIFTGKITNWQEVGGLDEPIVIYTREPGSGARETFESKALSGDQAALGTILNSNSAMKTAIGKDSRAIGYLALGQVDDRLKVVKIDGVAAAPDKIIAGSYPLMRRLYMNTKGAPSGLVESFVNYIFSPTGADMIRSAGFIPLNEGPARH